MVLNDWADEFAGPDYDSPGRRWPVDPPNGRIEGDGHLNIPTREEISQVWQKLKESI